MLPLGAGLGLKLLSGVMGVAVLAFGAFVLGFTRPELQRIGRFLILGIVVTYAGLLRLLGRGARGTAQAAQTRCGRAGRAAAGADAVIYDDARLADAPRVRRAEPALRDRGRTDDPAPEPEERGGFLSRMPGLLRKPTPLPDPELIETEGYQGETDPPEQDRIKARISDVIRTRARQNPALRTEEIAPLTKGRGRGPDPLILNTAPRDALPPEPPLTAASRRR